MKLRVLGKYGRFPVANSGTSSFMLNTERENFILDVGCSSLSNIQKYINITDITAVIISHLHGDHIADFKAFAYMVNIYKMEGRLDRNIIVYIPKTPEIVFDDLKYAKGIDYRIIADGMIDKIGDSALEFYQMNHPIETYGVRICCKDKTFAYTADTLLCDNMNKLLSDADVVVGDACILAKDHNKHSVHLSVKQLAQSAYDNNVNRLILAHLPDTNHKQILEEAKNILKNSSLAEEDIEYTL